MPVFVFMTCAIAMPACCSNRAYTSRLSKRDWAIRQSSSPWIHTATWRKVCRRLPQSIVERQVWSFCGNKGPFRFLRSSPTLCLGPSTRAKTGAYRMSDCWLTLTPGEAEGLCSLIAVSQVRAVHGLFSMRPILSHWMLAGSAKHVTVCSGFIRSVTRVPIG